VRQTAGALRPAKLARAESTQDRKIRIMDTNTLLIVVIVVLLLSGGGFYFRRR
jgi:LPXTG-motif cell wall-anchored protein